MSNENDYEPEVLEAVEIEDQPDDIFNDLFDTSGKSITELQWDDDGCGEPFPGKSFLDEEDSEGSCDNYQDCDDEFESLWTKVNDLEGIIEKLYEEVFKRKGPMSK